MLSSPPPRRNHRIRSQRSRALKSSRPRSRVRARSDAPKKQSGHPRGSRVIDRVAEADTATKTRVRSAKRKAKRARAEDERLERAARVTESTSEAALRRPPSAPGSSSSSRGQQAQQRRSARRSVDPAAGAPAVGSSSRGSGFKLSRAQEQSISSRAAKEIRHLRKDLARSTKLTADSDALLKEELDTIR